MILHALTTNWKKFADRFIPLHTENLAYVRKHPELMLDEDKVLAHERKLNMIRNCIESSSLRRPFKECSIEEIAEDKYKRLLALLDKRPELVELVESRIEKETI